MIRVENRKCYRGAGVYVGRSMRDIEGSVLGNPYKVKPHGSHERAESVELYRRWLWEHIRHGAGDVYEEVMRLKNLAAQGDLTLVCWCAPLPCHGTIIAKAIQWLIEQEGKETCF